MMILDYAAEAVSFQCEDSGLMQTVLALLRPSFGQSEPAGGDVTGAIDVRLGDAPPDFDTEKPWRRPPRLVMNDGNGPSFYVLDHVRDRVTLLRAAEEDAAVLRLLVDRAHGRWTVTAYDVGDDSARAVARVVKYFFGCLMTKRGCAVLHTAAVEKSGAAVLFSGPKGSGKSTLMMRSCTALGARFISDDLVVFWTDDGGALRCAGWPKRVAIPLSAFVDRAMPARGTPMKSRRAGVTPLENLAEPAEHRPADRRQRVQLDADEFLRCFGVDAAPCATPVAIVRLRFSTVEDSDWALTEGGADVYDGVIEPKHQWLFTDYLSLTPEPRGARVAVEPGDLLRRLPGYNLRYRDLSREDLETVWDSIQRRSAVLVGGSDAAGEPSGDRAFVRMSPLEL